MQLASYFDNRFYLGHAAMLVNEGLAAFVAERVKRELGGSLWGKSVGLLGMTFKPENDDVRDSLSFKVRKLLEFAGARVLCADPYLDWMLPLEDVLARGRGARARRRRTPPTGRSSQGAVRGRVGNHDDPSSRCSAPGSVRNAGGDREQEDPGDRLGRLHRRLRGRGAARARATRSSASTTTRSTARSRSRYDRHPRYRFVAGRRQGRRADEGARSPTATTSSRAPR